MFAEFQAAWLGLSISVFEGQLQDPTAIAAIAERIKLFAPGFVGSRLIFHEDRELFVAAAQGRLLCYDSATFPR